MLIVSGENRIKQNLLFGAVLQKQLKKNYAACHSDKDKQMHAKVISGHFLKKYKLGFMANHFISAHLAKKYRDRKNVIYERQNKKDSLGDLHKENICAFLEEDINSSTAPGKRDYVTVRKVRRQKRYMHDSVYGLYKKYLANSQGFLSYQTFCRLRPFWIVSPRIKDRDTCRCVKHANMAFMTEKLYQMKVVPKKSMHELCSQLCCPDTTSRKVCMYGECSHCKTKSLSVVPSAEKLNEQIVYQKWSSRCESRLDKNDKPIKVRIVVKDKISCTLSELVSETESILPSFLKHVYNIDHQYVEMKEKRLALQCNEVLILVDFSENYLSKYTDEIQSVHFGASRNQISLHTGVIYYMDQCISFCTVSSSLRHDPSIRTIFI